LNDIAAYKRALHISNKVWDIVISWDYFTKDTVGKQFARAVDSISANIAEGFGRYHKKDKIKFYRYAFGSLKESQDWLLKAKIRNLLSQHLYDELMKEFEQLPKDIYHLINYTNTKLSE